jgi:hypothetical protein
MPPPGSVSQGPMGEQGSALGFQSQVSAVR